MWNSFKNGFLPENDPITNLNDYPLIEELAQSLPDYVANSSIRTSLVQKLNNFDFGVLSQEESERMMMLFSYFASAYIHAPGEPKVNLLPKEIAIPLTKLAQIVKRPPILSYASYCLYNWKRIDPNKPIELGNIELLQNFTLSEGRRDENWFILVHVDIEAKAAKAINMIRNGGSFEDLYESITEMYNTLCRMPEECSADVYFDKVRPYIFSYENIVYEGVNAAPLTYRGETGAQSSCIPAIQIALGVRHKDSMLTEHLKDMRNYMPIEHRTWLAGLNIDFRELTANGLEDEYNKCLSRLVDFRKKHLEYAIDYIQKKTTNPNGTGGTPYVKWLSELIKETEEFYL